MSQVNEQLISVFGAGSGLKSAASNEINTSSSKIVSINEGLSALALEMAPEIIEPAPILTEIEEELKTIGTKITTNYIPSITSYSLNISTLNSHIEERLDKLFEELSVASAISQLSEYSDVDATVNTIAGSALGSLDTELQEADTVLDELILLIRDFNLDDPTMLQLAEFDLLLTQTTAELNNHGSNITQAVSDEASALSTLYSRYKQYSKAVSAQLLLADDNLSGFISQLAGPELEAALNT